MITHEEARDVLVNEKMVWNISLFAADYISQQEKLQAEHEALKRDVARYFELRSLPDDKYTTEVSRECVRLELKLWKVGKEE